MCSKEVLYMFILLYSIDFDRGREKKERTKDMDTKERERDEEMSEKS